MSAHDNIQTTKGVYAAFKRGDRAAILAVFAENIRLVSEPGAGELPWAGVYEGHAGVETQQDRLAEHAEVSDLEELDLRAANITRLPPEIGNLINLSALDLGENQFTSLPPEIGEVNRLFYLGLDGNPLSTLSTGISKLTDLVYLVLDSDQMSSLSPEIGTLPVFEITSQLLAAD